MPGSGGVGASGTRPCTSSRTHPSLLASLSARSIATVSRSCLKNWRNRRSRRLMAVPAACSALGTDHTGPTDRRLRLVVAVVVAVAVVVVVAEVVAEVVVVVVFVCLCVCLCGRCRVCSRCRLRSRCHVSVDVRLINPVEKRRPRRRDMPITGQFKLLEAVAARRLLPHHGHVSVGCRDACPRCSDPRLSPARGGHTELGVMTSVTMMFKPRSGQTRQIQTGRHVDVLPLDVQTQVVSRASLYKTCTSTPSRRSSVRAP